MVLHGVVVVHPKQLVHFGAVHLVVRNLPSVVFKRILEGCENDNDNQRHRLHSRTLHSENLETPKNDDEQEVRIGDVGELEENVHRDKVQRRVLRRPDLIPRVQDLIPVCLWVNHVLGQALVVVYLPHRVGVRLSVRLVEPSFERQFIRLVQEASDVFLHRLHVNEAE